MKYRIIISIFVLFTLISTGMILHTKNLQENVVKTSGLYNAQLYSNAIATFRTIYTSEVVSVAERYGLEITHDYQNKKAIPLPATLSMILGNKIGESGSGESVKLYSPFPFPWRKETGGLRDNFSEKAWQYFSTNADKPFYKFYVENNKRYLRYAVADKMRTACVNCHNNHPDTPKADWKTGDVRGVLEITIPLDKVMAKAENDLIFTSAAYFILSVLGVIGIIYMIQKYKTEASELENAVTVRTAQLEQEKINATRANAAKTVFLANMSHELRTPMNAILGFGQLLEAGASTEAEKEQSREILVAGKHLLGLIEKVLDLSKIESGQFDLDIVPVSVDEAIEEILGLFTTLAENKDVHIETPAATGLIVNADRARLRQVLINLISNAIIYNRDHGSVEISVELVNTGTIRISVSDNGRGIEADQQENLFKAFERLGMEDKCINGIGVGLAISKRLVEAMHGKIGMESTPGEGSTFWIELAPANHNNI